LSAGGTFTLALLSPDGASPGPEVDIDNPVYLWFASGGDACGEEGEQKPLQCVFRKGAAPCLKSDDEWFYISKAGKYKMYAGGDDGEYKAFISSATPSLAPAPTSYRSDEEKAKIAAYLAKKAKQGKLPSATPEYKKAREHFDDPEASFMQTSSSAATSSPQADLLAKKAKYDAEMAAYQESYLAKKAKKAKKAIATPEYKEAPGWSREYFD